VPQFREKTFAIAVAEAGGKSDFEAVLIGLRTKHRQKR